MGISCKALANCSSITQFLSLTLPRLQERESAISLVLRPTKNSSFCFPLAKLPSTGRKATDETPQWHPIIGMANKLPMTEVISKARPMHHQTTERRCTTMAIWRMLSNDILRRQQRNRLLHHHRC